MSEWSNEIENHGFDELYIHWLVELWYKVNDLIEVKWHYFFFFQKGEGRSAKIWIFGTNGWYDGEDFVDEEVWFSGVSEYLSRWELILEMHDGDDVISRKVSDNWSLVGLSPMDTTASEMLDIILWGQSLN